MAHGAALMPRRLLRHTLIVTPTAQHIEAIDGYVLLDGERIAAVGAGEPLLDNLDNIDETVDLQGLTVIPGLINCHTHASLSLHRGLSDDADLFAWAAHNYPTIQALSEHDFRLGSELA